MQKKIIVNGNQVELDSSPPFTKKYILKKVTYGEKEKGDFRWVVFYFEDKKFKKQIMSPCSVLDNRGNPSFLFMFLDAIGKSYEDIPVLDDYIGMTFAMTEHVNPLQPSKFYKRKDGTEASTLNLVVSDIWMVRPNQAKIANDMPKVVQKPVNQKVKLKEEMASELASEEDFNLDQW